LRCGGPILKICAGALSDTLKPVIRGGRRAAHFGVSVSFVVNLMTAYRLGGSLAPKPLGGRRHAKFDPPHRVFLLRRVAEKDDVTMPELAEELEAACGAKAAPGPISRWFIRNGYRFKNNASGQRMRSPRHSPGARAMES
jgi:transposase